MHGELDDMEYTSQLGYITGKQRTQNIRRTWNTISSWPGVTFEVSAGEHRAHEEQENVEYIYYLVGLDLKFAIVLENGGEHRAHGELELERGILSSWVTFEVCARERWRTQSTWRTGEHGILSS